MSTVNLMQNLESFCQGSPEAISETEKNLSEMIEQLSHLREKLKLEKHQYNDEVR